MRMFGLVRQWSLFRYHMPCVCMFPVLLSDKELIPLQHDLRVCMFAVLLSDNGAYSIMIPRVTRVRIFAGVFADVRLNLTTKCGRVFENFHFKGPKMKLGSVCRADQAQSKGPTLRSLANFNIELEKFCCSLTAA